MLAREDYTTPHEQNLVDFIYDQGMIEESIVQGLLYMIPKELENPINKSRDDMQSWLANDFGKIGKKYGLRTSHMFEKLDDLKFLVDKIDPFYNECFYLVAAKLFKYGECSVPNSELLQFREELKKVIRNIPNRRYSRDRDLVVCRDQRALGMYAFITLYLNASKEEAGDLYSLLIDYKTREMFFIVIAVMFNKPLLVCGYYDFPSVCNGHIFHKHEDCIPYVLIADRWQKERKNKNTNKWTTCEGKDYYNKLIDASQEEYHSNEKLQRLLALVWTHVDWNPADYSFCKNKETKKKRFVPWNNIIRKCVKEVTSEALSNVKEDIMKLNAKHEAACEQNAKAHERIHRELGKKQASNVEVNVNGSNAKIIGVVDEYNENKISKE